LKRKYLNDRINVDSLSVITITLEVCNTLMYFVLQKSFMFTISLGNIFSRNLAKEARDVHVFRIGNAISASVHKHSRPGRRKEV